MAEGGGRGSPTTRLEGTRRVGERVPSSAHTEQVRSWARLEWLRRLAVKLGALPLAWASSRARGQRPAVGIRRVAQHVE